MPNNGCSSQPQSEMPVFVVSMHQTQTQNQHKPTVQIYCILVTAVEPTNYIQKLLCKMYEEHGKYRVVMKHGEIKISPPVAPQSPCPSKLLESSDKRQHFLLTVPQKCGECNPRSLSLDKRKANYLTTMMSINYH